MSACCDYSDHSPGPCGCSEHEKSALHPFGNVLSTLLGVPDFDEDFQAEHGQGPPA